MTDTDNTIILAGRIVGFVRPTQGQKEVLIRIGRTLARGTEDDPVEFWQKQVDRLGTVLDSLIAEGDRDMVDQLYLTGKIEHRDLLVAIFGKLNAEAEADEKKTPTKAKAKASSAHVKRD